MTDKFNGDVDAELVKDRVELMEVDEARLYLEKIIRDFEERNDVDVDEFSVTNMKALCYIMSERFSKVTPAGKQDDVSRIWRAVAKQVDICDKFWEITEYKFDKAFNDPPRPGTWRTIKHRYEEKLILRCPLCNNSFYAKIADAKVVGEEEIINHDSPVSCHSCGNFVCVPVLKEFDHDTYLERND